MDLSLSRFLLSDGKALLSKSAKFVPQSIDTDNTSLAKFMSSIGKIAIKCKHEKLKKYSRKKKKKSQLTK